MASLAVGLSTPNLSYATDPISEDTFHSDYLRCYWMMQRSSLLRSRSRRPLSVDDVHVAEALLNETPLDNESFGFDSGVFLPSPLSSASSFNSYSEGYGMSSPDISGSFKTSTPNGHRWLYSCPEDTNLCIPPEPSLEVIFSDVSEDIGASWRRLGRHMLKRECVLSNIDEDFKGVGEKAYQLLLKWKEEGGATATPQALFLALLRIKRTDVAKKLMKLVPSLSSLSHLLDGVISSCSILYNSKEEPENLKVEKVLCQEENKVLVCSSMETSQRFVLMQIEGEENAFAVRKCIDCKALRQKKQRLRKTEEFLKDLEMKQKMIQNLLDVIKQLQNHLLKQHQDISQQLFSCQNCDQYTIKQDLVQRELTLLHHELERMSQNRSRRISISGIPSERIYNLATRTYDVCAEHREMHLRSRNRRSVCQHPEEMVDSDDSDESIEGPLMCALNIVLSIGRRRKVTQSLKTKKSSAQSKKKLSKSNSNPSTASSRKSYLLAQENPVMLPCFLRSPDWSGVPAFKLSSDFKSPLSSGNSKKQTTQEANTQVSAKPSTSAVDKHDQLLPLQWLKDLEPDEVII
ncbi:hypothetical protein ACROYT_G011486 [Oculina patagonica]